MQNFLTIILAILFFSTSFSQAPVQRPKLIVGIVVDQMRWDYLYRFYERYGDKGFKRLLNDGFSCENTFIPYAPTVTACGHASIYTGSVPAINGITGNNWFDYENYKPMYCTQDDSVQTVGSTTNAGAQSPKNLLTTTIGDELMLATNFKSKVVGVAIKDRGSILPAGHSATAAYWYDSKTGDFITSTFYMNALPTWVNDFNAKKYPDTYYKEGWKTLYPLNSYVHSTADINTFENKPFGQDKVGFPYDLSKFAGNNYSAVTSTPYGNTLTSEMAKAALVNEQLGADDITDMLAISFSSPDYVGHAFGPNSVEAEDIFLRLDKEIADLLDFFDTKVGKGQYTVFLSADHGAAHVPAFVKSKRMPGGVIDPTPAFQELNQLLKKEFGKADLVLDMINYQVNLNTRLFDGSKINIKAVKTYIVNYLSTMPGIDRVFDLDDVQTIPLNETIRKMVNNGYSHNRSGQVQVIFKPQFIEGFGAGGTTHGLWNPYDAHIPLVWYGAGIKKGLTNRETYMTDIAATLAAMLKIQMPSGCIGTVISEAIQ